MNSVEWLKQRVSQIYDRNPFIKLLDIRIIDVKAGESILEMNVRHDMTNLYQNAHGGALATIADTSMGVTCASYGKKCMTLDFNINFIHGAPEGQTIRAYGKVIHNGKSTLVTESEIKDCDGTLLAKARGTFFVIGKWESDER